MKVLFVSTARFDRSPWGDGSTRYRCFNVAEELIAAGHQADVTPLSELSLQRLDRYDIVSILRPRYSRALQRLVNTARRRSIHLVVDFDDLIFDVDMASQSPMVVNRFADESQVRKSFKLHAKAISLFDEITVSTTPLALAARKLFPSLPVTVMRNGLSRFWLAHCPDADAGPANPLITYLPGSRSHDEDFRQVQRPLSQWLKEDKTRSVRIVGSMALDQGIFPDAQISHLPLVSYFALPALIQQSTATIAPLVDNTFNQAKSHIKFTESAALGVPSICSPNQDMLEHASQPELSLPQGEDEWALSLARLSAGHAGDGRRQALQHYARTACTMQHLAMPTIQRWAALVAQQPQHGAHAHAA